MAPFAASSVASNSGRGAALHAQIGQEDARRRSDAYFSPQQGTSVRDCLLVGFADSSSHNKSWSDSHGETASQRLLVAAFVTRTFSAEGRYGRPSSDWAGGHRTADRGEDQIAASLLEHEACDQP